jgi:drug/metabolite transporter (DMT)-like permease
VSFWAVVLFFVVAQNLQVALYGWAFNRTDEDSATLHRIVDAFREPVFLASLLLLSVATAVCRLVLFPDSGVARTHVVTSTAVVLSFALFAIVFREDQSLSRYAGATLCAIGIYLIAR